MIFLMKYYHKECLIVFLEYKGWKINCCLKTLLENTYKFHLVFYITLQLILFILIRR